MRELADILAAVVEHAARDEPVALATVVAARGSTYRRAGARYLVAPNGCTIGSLSGGCLEGDVAGAAEQVIATGQARLLSFDLTADDEAVWGWGLGCNGAIDVLVERVDPEHPAVTALDRVARDRRTLALIAVLDGDLEDLKLGVNMVVDEDGAAGSLGHADLDTAAIALAQDCLATGNSRAQGLATDQGTARLFVEVIQPPIRLVVCGAGHDARALVRTAAALGWQVDVVDERESLLDRADFPDGHGFVHTDRPHEASAATNADDRTHVVVMSHNYIRDLEYLRSFLDSPVPFIGMLGPAGRTEQLLGDLTRQGVSISADDRQRIHGPAGLDLGAEGPEEIALAIVAEVLSSARGHAGGHLRDRDGGIHEPASHIRA